MENSTENHKPKKELFRDLDRLRSEVITLRNQLNKLGSEKESWFGKKRLRQGIQAAEGRINGRSKKFEGKAPGDGQRHKRQDFQLQEA